MGLFDRFRRRVTDLSETVDLDALTAEEDSEEGRAALRVQALSTEAEGPDQADEGTVNDSAPSTDDGWDDLDALDEPKTRSERRRRKRDLRRPVSAPRASERPVGSNVDLKVMRSTTGRELTEVTSTPRGSTRTGQLSTMSGDEVLIDLGGGIVESGGRVIKDGPALATILEELEWVLLESDISATAVSSMVDSLRYSLIGARLRKGADLAKVLEASLKRALRALLDAGYWDVMASIETYLEAGDAPVVIMFVGVNGTGKTTTVAKIAKQLTDRGRSVIAAAGDTFRAGAIEQLEHHCERIGIRCVSSERGGDSAAIARDAVESARARGVDVVLVDTAGRMQNKSNLMKELEKVRRVADPHLTLFVGDALAGNDAVDQAVMFQRMLRFDGAVLTKLDTDAKGGAALSIAYATGRPVVLAGMGQGYDDLVRFDPEWLLEEIFT